MGRVETMSKRPGLGAPDAPASVTAESVDALGDENQGDPKRIKADAEAAPVEAKVAAVEDDVVDNVDLFVDIPAAAAGYIIGKKGASIKALIEEAGAQIRLQGEVTAEHPKAKRVTISGPQAKREKAFEMLKKRVTEYAEKSTSGGIVEIRSIELADAGVDNFNTIPGLQQQRGARVPPPQS